MSNEKNASHRCPECGETPSDVSLRTVRHMLVPFVNQEVRDGEQYRICKVRDCPVVYFTEGGQRFTTGQIRTPVNFKLEKDTRPYPLCYCFGYGTSDVLADLRENGETHIDEWIGGRVRAGECACEVKNPKGSCCLGDVREAIEALKSEDTENEPPDGGPNRCCFQENEVFEE